MRKLPDFVCVGAQKAGTTTLHDILKCHPDIFLPGKKEAHFFDQEDRYVKGIDWWLDYFFQDFNGQQSMGVVTPEYLFYEEVPERIYQHLGPDTKIIVILRNPVLRAYSHYLMSLRRGLETMSFIDALNNETERLKESEAARNHFSYVSRGIYTEQLERYLSLFGRENVKILLFERDIIDNIDDTIIDIQRFIGVNPIALDTNMKSNPATRYRFAFLNSMLRTDNLLKRAVKAFVKSRGSRILLAKTLKHMNRSKDKIEPLSLEEQKKVYCNYFEEEIGRLEELLGQSLSFWRYDA